MVGASELDLFVASRDVQPEAEGTAEPPHK